MRYWSLWSMLLMVLASYSCTSNAQNARQEQAELKTGADQFERYVPQLEGKRVGLLINQTSEVDAVSLLDTLLAQGVQVVKVFVPEHGFRGKAEAGEKVKSGVDEKTQIPIVSLYGRSKKPKEQDLKDIDVLIYDLQDVGARFYTYISTMQYAMEACAQYGVSFMILDRPNPNGHYVDGPVLDKSQRSFVGMQSIPIVYGMTAGEYAQMLVGEKWFLGAEKLNLTIIPCANYDHNTRYTLPINPSPNLRTMAAIYCYPSLCFFEGTVVSVGRGTNTPFQQFGHPAFKGKTNYSFIPDVPFKGPSPKLAGEHCYGQMIAQSTKEADHILRNSIRLRWLIMAYNWYPEKEKFFNNFFSKLAGTTQLRKQIEQGMSEAEIKATWQEDLDAFKEIRKKYLLYTDFTP